jgi:hypothetical protein
MLRIVPLGVDESPPFESRRSRCVDHWDGSVSSATAPCKQAAKAFGMSLDLRVLSPQKPASKPAMNLSRACCGNFMSRMRNFSMFDRIVAEFLKNFSKIRKMKSKEGQWSVWVRLIF